MHENDIKRWIDTYTDEIKMGDSNGTWNITIYARHDIFDKHFIKASGNWPPTLEEIKNIIMSVNPRKAKDQGYEVQESKYEIASTEVNRIVTPIY